MLATLNSPRMHACSVCIGLVNMTGQDTMASLVKVMEEVSVL